MAVVVEMTKPVSVQGSMGDESWDDYIDTQIDLKLVTNDEITFFPEYVTHANFFVDGATSKDVMDNSDVDVAFTESDFQDEAKIASAAKKISSRTADYIEHEYDDYISQNQSEIEFYQQHGDPRGGDSAED